ncbi:histone-like nucleoid-structuring protein Lsr2 [Streptomyces sp. NPDC059096]|uniref:Lsr2 family DNA-binding protein n=1 Tax=Streptomyces sp. NPDC059096 TaxID=3346727 RepID=UPI0036C29812
MFNDWQQALESEGLPLALAPAQQLAAAARVTARHAHSTDDLALLLDVLGLPTDTDTALLPSLLESGDAPTMANTPAPALSAFEAMGVSMHTNGDSEQTIREATGLSETELHDLIAAHAPGQQPDAVASPAVIDVPVAARPVADGLQPLLDWAAAHPAASVRRLAARITTDLSDLTERRTSEAAQREAETKVAQARAALEQAQAELRTVKAGTRNTASVPTPIRTGAGSGRTREELTAIRAWAREHGHQVAGQGMVPKRVLEAYDAAHQAPLRKAG